MKRRALAALVLLALLATGVAAHTRLERSHPAAGTVLDVPPAEIRLVFSQRVAARYTSLVLYAPSGDVIPTAALRTDDDARDYWLPAPPLTQPGAYRVEWKTTASDGHVITGSFSFALAFADPTMVPPSVPDTVTIHEHHADESRMPPLLRSGSWLNVLMRALQFTALILLIGLAAFRAVLLPRAERSTALRQNLRRYGALVLTLFLLTLPVRLWLQSAALHGPELATEPQLVGSMLLELNWGRAWLAQLAGAGFAAIAILTGFTPLLVAASVPLAVAPAFQGHAAAAQPAFASITADVVHICGAGAWIGTLAALLLVAAPSYWRAPDRDRHIALLVHRFTPLALACAALLALTGIVSALFHVHEWSQLATSAYGRTLLLKLFVVALVLATGWYNWQRSRPALAAGTGARAFRRAAALELGFAIVALVITAILVALPTP